MAFSCKIVLGEHLKEDDTRRVYLQAIIDRRKAAVPLGFYLRESEFDKKRQCMKAGHPNANTFDAELIKAIARAHDIASRHRLEGKPLTPSLFRDSYKEELTSKDDLVKFISAELKLKQPSIAFNTHKQHNTLVNKLKDFKRQVLFQDINSDLVQKFRNHLLKKNSEPTVHKLMKILKHYLMLASRKGIKFSDPDIRVKSFQSTRVSLTEAEVQRVDQYYRSPNCKPNHKRLLRYFLFSCFTGLRISDIKIITWENIHDDLLIFTPEKTKREHKQVTVPLNAIDKQYLPPYKPGKQPIFDTFADPVTNRLLKEIAKECDIKKKLTYHVSRHTFGSLFAEGGNIVALQRIMGHGDIKTTMGYVHTSIEALVRAKEERFGKMKPH